MPAKVVHFCRPYSNFNSSVGHQLGAVSPACNSPGSSEPQRAEPRVTRPHCGKHCKCATSLSSDGCIFNRLRNADPSMPTKVVHFCRPYSNFNSSVGHQLGAVSPVCNSPGSSEPQRAEPRVTRSHCGKHCKCATSLPSPNRYSSIFWTADSNRYHRRSYRDDFRE
jgi:hypothetical protein